MARVCYIGDEVTAAGYRLAGADVRVPVPSEAGEVFRRACAEGADLILLSAALVAEIDAEELSTALITDAPLVAIVADAFGRCPPPDFARDVRLSLGIES